MGKTILSIIKFRVKKEPCLISFLFLLFVIFHILLFPLSVNGKDGSMEHTIFRINSEVIVEINEVYDTIISLNSSVDIRGRVNGSVISLGKPVYIHGEVENNVLVLGADIILIEGSAIRNNTITIGGEILQSYGSMIGGNIQEMNNFFRWDFSGFMDQLTHFLQYPFIHFSFGSPGNFLLFRLIFMLVITALLVLLLPKKIKNVAESVQHQPWKAFFIGLLALLCLIPIIVFLGITIIGIIIIPIILLLFLLAGFIGGIAVNYLVGYRMLSAFNFKDIALLWGVFAGLVVLEMIRMIPVAAMVIFPLLYLLGLGGVIDSLFRGKIN